MSMWGGMEKMCVCLNAYICSLKKYISEEQYCSQNCIIISAAHTVSTMSVSCWSYMHSHHHHNQHPASRLLSPNSFFGHELSLHFKDSLDSPSRYPAFF